MTRLWLRLDRPWNLGLLRGVLVCGMLAFLAGAGRWLASAERGKWLRSSAFTAASFALLFLGLLLLLVTIQDWAEGETWYTLRRSVSYGVNRAEERACKWAQAPAWFALVLLAKGACGVLALSAGVGGLLWLAGPHG